jgi:hypothetical protein
VEEKKKRGECEVWWWVRRGYEMVVGEDEEGARKRSLFVSTV